MGPAFRWLTICGLALAGSAGVRAADFQLTPDETRRLDADVDRDAKKGTPESAEHKGQRQKMNRRYSERCVGITRAGAQPR